MSGKAYILESQEIYFCVLKKLKLKILRQGLRQDLNRLNNTNQTLTTEKKQLLFELTSIQRVKKGHKCNVAHRFVHVQHTSWPIK
jgi:hypothetical protein